ncbi:hypothetical protein Fmac_025910 [Flemingia macrophylla]|uniref:Uncharacterized protein n=1 Tax=Flemingia macrophylla TaxID=520843 RepID=A0ABD1LDI3_9FABA
MDDFVFTPSEAYQQLPPDAIVALPPPTYKRLIYPHPVIKQQPWTPPQATCQHILPLRTQPTPSPSPPRRKHKYSPGHPLSLIHPLLLPFPNKQAGSSGITVAEKADTLMVRGYRWKSPCKVYHFSDSSAAFLRYERREIDFDQAWQSVTDTWYKPHVYDWCKDLPPWHPGLPLPWDSPVSTVAPEVPSVSEAPSSAPVDAMPISVAPSSLLSPRLLLLKWSLWMLSINSKVTLMQNSTSSTLCLPHLYHPAIRPLLDVDKGGEIYRILGSDMLTKVNASDTSPDEADVHHWTKPDIFRRSLNLNPSSSHPFISDNLDLNNIRASLMNKIAFKMEKFARFMGVPLKVTTIGGHRESVITLLRRLRLRIVTVVEEEADLVMGMEGFEFVEGLMSV